MSNLLVENCWPVGFNHFEKHAKYQIKSPQDTAVQHQN